MTMDDFYKQTQERLFDSILSRSYEWYSEEPPESEEELAFYGEETNLPLFDETDKLILMHRDVHFSSSFSAMKEYYLNEEARGIVPDIEVERIAFLERVQSGLGKDIASILISGREAEKIAAAKKMYQELSNVANTSSLEGKLASALLSERGVEELAEELVSEVKQRPEMLIPLACSEFFCDPLFPSYGTGAQLALRLIGKLRYEKAIEPLFYQLGRFTEYSLESDILEALFQIGEPVKNLAMKKISSLPITEDNERSALILLKFLPDEEIAALFKRSLELPQIEEHPSFREYLEFGLKEEA